jgi:hypothetical protein
MAQYGTLALIETQSRLNDFCRLAHHFIDHGYIISISEAVEKEDEIDVEVMKSLMEDITAATKPIFDIVRDFRRNFQAWYWVIIHLRAHCQDYEGYIIRYKMDTSLR